MTQQTLTKISTAILERMAEQRKEFPQYSTWQQAQTVIEIKIKRASEQLDNLIADHTVGTANFAVLTELPELYETLSDVSAHCLLAACECGKQKIMWAHMFDAVFTTVGENQHFTSSYDEYGPRYLFEELITANFDLFKHNFTSDVFPEAILKTIASHIILLIPYFEKYFNPLITLTIPQEKESCNQN